MKRMLSPLLFVSSVLVFQFSASAQPIMVGFTNCLATANYSQPLMSEIGQFKWFFAHASVGGNMMSGVSTLRAINTNFYQIRGVSDDSAPPATTQTGVVYDYSRGNPGWQSKFDIFRSCVSNGWRYPKINIAVDKLCYIDPDANLDYYLNSMTVLETAYPETVFVYMTIPLTTSEDSDNYSRSVYNDSLRDWVRTNNRVLYDIADIESHDTNGVRCTFTYNGRLCERLYSGYSSDGGHLNTPGSQLVASGFYALAGALLAADRDGDGVTDGHELIAGTSPVSANSVLKVNATAGTGSGSLRLQWNSSSNRLYRLQRGTDLFNAASFTNLVLDAAATPPLNTFTDSPPAAGTFFYRVGVRQ
jgi:hypothetical protein